MFGHRSPTRWHYASLTTGAMAAWLLILTFADRAHAIPTFSRKYQTSCITCHWAFPKLNDVGEAFRRNGYQFPSDEDVLVKEEPVKLGVESYKDMFPNSIWPSTLPGMPPIFIRATMWNMIHTTHPEAVDPPGAGDNTVEKKWDMELPHEVAIGGAGVFGKDISAWWELMFAPPEGDMVGVERCFVQFSNLFAWDEEEDADGMHLGNRWAVLPKHALNLRLGRMETSVLPHVASEHARLSAIEPLPNLQTIGFTGFSFEAPQEAVELHGIIRQYWSYAVGFANGGSASGAAFDDNTFKDVYFRVAHKWFGYPLDGVIGQPEQAGGGAPQGGGGDESEFATPGLDFWRALGFETGVFGWEGKAEVPSDPFNPASPPPVGPPFRDDYFQRIGADARLQYFDLDLYGVFYWAHDPFAGLSPLDGITDPGPVDHFSYFVEADYMIKPWIIGFLKYEQTKIANPAFIDQEQSRVVPGIIFMIRQNMRLSTEAYIDTLGRHNMGPQATDQIITQLDWTF